MPTTRGSQLKSRCRSSAMSLFLEPTAVILCALYDQNAPHFIVAKAAELSAGKFEPADARGGEPEIDRHPGHGVLLDAEVGEEKAVDDVLGAKPDLHRTVDHGVKDIQRNQIVSSVRVNLVEAERVVEGDEFRVGSSIDRVGTGVTYVPTKLFGRDFDFQRAGWRSAAEILI